ncbi:hypothetical protein ACFXPA_31355 [Amycolatopsis sp. NPDC059090]|uniref:hypothetical protein n=1 Tax=Amycolatopsis sp. NPDC059090 TaxID=3346723 RepID=UPI00366B9AB6
MRAAPAPPHAHSYLTGTGWTFEAIGIFDLAPDRAAAMAERVRIDGGPEVRACATAEEVVSSCDLIVFATVATAPHITDPRLFAHNPVVLHLSLRDLAPEVVLSASNVVDDVDHCLKAGTSLHLAEQQTGNRDFLDGTIDDVLNDRLSLRADRPLVFSPFGLGVLDLAVGKHVYDQLADAGRLTTVANFFCP